MLSDAPHRVQFLFLSLLGKIVLKTQEQSLELLLAQQMKKKTSFSISSREIIPFPE